MDRAFAPLAMSPGSQQQIFVYGTFLWIQKPKTQAFFGTADEPDIALEILREFGASEFVGKLYTKPVIGDWTIAQSLWVKSLRSSLGDSKPPGE